MYCARKMKTSLLRMASHPEGRGIRPHSLKAATISALMTDVIKGTSSSPQIAIQGDYRDVATRDMEKSTQGTSRNDNSSYIISRNRLFAIATVIGIWQRSRWPFLGIAEDSEVGVSASHGKGRIEADCAIKHLSLRKSAICKKNGIRRF